eukprot:CAMPEP_0184684582 /NCGR_PEP_ID=MMETSP0312-20130426/15871_1 /TAXON_ID=31354 /ORGANISM="Compsopogon coeruleus, Strain SAG 36.94" /LENGTH=84 /DNA_ID=CAMNT_0027137903 /DNA_START=159 /DNA_END=413 /DNA_ORIENTATION=+
MFSSSSSDSSVDDALHHGEGTIDSAYGPSSHLSVFTGIIFILNPNLIAGGINIMEETEPHCLSGRITEPLVLRFASGSCREELK